MIYRSFVLLTVWSYLEYFSVINTYVYGGKLLLFYTVILKLVDRNYATFKCVGKLRNDLRIIYLAYCLVLTSIV